MNNSTPLTVLTARGGTYTAPSAAVAEKLRTTTKARMIQECQENFPEMFGAMGSWTVAGLRAEPSYVLAVYLTQI